LSHLQNPQEVGGGAAGCVGGAERGAAGCVGGTAWEVLLLLLLLLLLLSAAPPGCAGLGEAGAVSCGRAGAVAPFAVGPVFPPATAPKCVLSAIGVVLASAHGRVVVCVGDGEGRGRTGAGQVDGSSKHPALDPRAHHAGQGRAAVPATPDHSHLWESSWGATVEGGQGRGEELFKLWQPHAKIWQQAA